MSPCPNRLCAAEADGEYYCNIFSACTAGDGFVRYFNVYGPRQDPPALLRCALAVHEGGARTHAARDFR